MYLGCKEIYATFKKGLEHSQILISMGVLESSPYGVQRMTKSVDSPLFLLLTIPGLIPCEQKAYFHGFRIFFFELFSVLTTVLPSRCSIRTWKSVSHCWVAWSCMSLSSHSFVVLLQSSVSLPCFSLTPPITEGRRLSSPTVTTKLFTFPFNSISIDLMYFYHGCLMHMFSIVVYS